MCACAVWKSVRDGRLQTEESRKNSFPIIRLCFHILQRWSSQFGVCVLKDRIAINKLELTYSVHCLVSLNLHSTGDADRRGLSEAAQKSLKCLSCRTSVLAAASAFVLWIYAKRTLSKTLLFTQPCVKQVLAENSPRRTTEKNLRAPNFRVSSSKQYFALFYCSVPVQRLRWKNQSAAAPKHLYPWKWCNCG